MGMERNGPLKDLPRREAIGIALQGFGTGLQGGDPAMPLLRRKAMLESEQRKQVIAEQLAKMGVAGPQRSILETMPIEAQQNWAMGRFDRQDAMAAQKAEEQRRIATVAEALGMTGAAGLVAGKPGQLSASPDLVQRVMMQESGGNPDAVSPAGAVGLMQTMPDTLTDPGFGVRPASDPNDPAERARVGVDYLNAMLNRYSGNLPRALAAYNWGPGNADKWDGRMESLPAETRNYIAKITGGQSYNKIARILSDPSVPDTIKQQLMSTYGIGQPQAPKPTDDIREYQFAVENGFEGSFQDWMYGNRAAGATTVNVGTDQDAVEADKPAKGYERIWNEDEQRFEDRPIKGSPPWQELVDSGQKVKRSLESFQEQNSIVLDNIDRAIELLETSEFPATSLANTLSSAIPGSPAARLNSLLEPVKSNVAFDYLVDMRKNSPTGGAVGQLSDSEREAMESIQGSLSGANTKADLLYNLQRLKEVRRNAERRLVEAANQDFRQVGITFGGKTREYTPDEINALPRDELVKIGPEDIATMSAAAVSALVKRLEKEVNNGN